MKIPDVEPAQLIRVLENDVYAAYFGWLAYRCMAVDDPLARALVKKHLGYFGNFLLDALLNDVLLRLQRLNDKRHDVFTVGRVVKHLVHDHPDIAKDADMESLFAVLDESLRSVKAIRHKKLAHRDLQKRLGQGRPLEPVTVDQIETAFKTIATLIDAVKMPLTGNHFILENASMNGAEGQLLTKLKQIDRLRA